MDWQAVPLVWVPLGRFVVPLHDIDVAALRRPRTGPVLAFTRWPLHGDVWVHDGRHRVLSALFSGQSQILARLLVLE